MRYWRKFIEILFLIFIFILPWQTKYIWRAGVNNFLEISFYLSQILLVVIFLIAIIYLLRNYSKNNLEFKTIDPIWYLFGILEVMILVSTFFASDKLLSAYHYGIFLLGFILYFLLQTGFKNYSYNEGFLNRSRVGLSFLLSLFLQSILAIYQFLSQRTFAFKFLGLAQHDPQNLGVSVIETSTGRWLRAYGGMDHPNIFGGVLVFGLLFSIFLLISTKIISSKREKWLLISLFVTYFLSLSALIFTFSRSAWLAFFVALFVLAILLFFQAEKAVFIRFLFISIFSIVFFALTLFAYQDLLITRIKGNTRLEQISIKERQEQLDTSLTLIQGNFAFGVGPGNYLLASQQDVSTNLDYAQPVHNAFLLLFAESGIGALTILLSIFYFFGRYKKEQTLSLPFLIALIILMMLDHWLISLPFGILFLFFVLGMI